MIGCSRPPQGFDRGERPQVSNATNAPGAEAQALGSRPWRRWLDSTYPRGTNAEGGHGRPGPGISSWPRVSGSAIRLRASRTVSQDQGASTSGMGVASDAVNTVRLRVTWT